MNTAVHMTKIFVREHCLIAVYNTYTVHVCGQYKVHCKKAFVILTIAFVTRVATVGQNSPWGSQLWAIQHTWSTGTAAVATRTGKFAKALDKCYTQQKGHSLVETGHR